MAETVDKEGRFYPEIDALVETAARAGREFMSLDQEQVDKIVQAMAMAGLDKHMELAKMAVEETRRGVYEDKITKNIFATEAVYHSIKYKKTVGIIREDEEEEYLEVAEPLGVVAAVVPVTNPTSTTMFKALICMKTRNPIIFSFHPGARGCSAAAAKVMLEAAVKAGAPENCISWLEKSGIEATGYLMKHPGVSTIIATGGAGLVRAAYTTGKPALGVGPGNVPCYIDSSARLKRAVTDLIMSKTFDNGLICASEQSVVIHREVAERVKSLMKEYGCYFLRPEEIKKLEGLVSPGDGPSCALNADIVGQPAGKIAEMAGISAPPGTRVLVAELSGVGPEHPLSMEKLSPILSCYVAGDHREGIELCEKVVEFGGLGHSAVVHAEDESVIKEFYHRIRTGRIIVNSPSTHGAIGDLYNVNVPSFTLGCGSMGSNSTTSNVSVDNLINVKRVAKRRDKIQWFRVPERIYFESGAVQYLSKFPGIGRVFIVTDQVVQQLGMVDKVKYHLNKRNNQVAVEVFSDVEPDPSVDTVRRGCAVMKDFKPDTIIALGGGSPIDAAKAMWLFYEHPGVEFEFLRLKFMDIRKRTYKYPKLGRRASLIAIPTTSGTGSEVTAFAVISDHGKHIKYPLADYELTPDVAIIDPNFAMSMPPRVAADTGMDVLVHALESYVSVMASEYTDALALKAVELVYKYLLRSYKNPSDREAREKMHYASCIAGMAFTNAFLGINHSLAHKLGAEFGISHGRANAVLLPYVIAYNASRPAKFTSYPQYEYFQAPEKYRQIAAYLGFPAETAEQGVRSLVEAVRGLLRGLEMPAGIAGLGVDRERFSSLIPAMAEQAFDDQVTGTNPRFPLIAELADLYRLAYGSPLAAGVDRNLLDFSLLNDGRKVEISLEEEEKTIPPPGNGIPYAPAREPGGGIAESGAKPLH
ncbi:alcohol dehydrogenase [Desulfocucumis palustris]|uniref:Aldehyde-alcohol dehydrogenase n=1 Tax=Desulfocucumis palustris TaxID=1898651 RepID=A0A2L2XA64_9FIRM|nr:bifunctional acetaldehyde-CoA/alcohol dehydrogenase [Desulfocucumis palustris]GBF32960.1 alcohol dehydrogenase [Desulfocucumis palustris]